MRRMVDPPGGWMYGFPKEIKGDEEVRNMIEWLVANGYPREVIKSYGNHFYVRQWTEDENKA